jgi:hypothetical protein
MDERYDTVRAIRTATHRYVKNYSPHRPAGQHYTYAFSVQPSMRSWFEQFRAGRCNETQAKYWLSKSSEEFYEIESDPYELNDLAASETGDAITKLRSQLRARIISLRDVGFIPEGMFTTLAGESTIYDYAQSDGYPIQKIVDLADKATSRESLHLDDLTVGANDPHPVIRYWAATGFLVLRQSALSAKSDVIRLTQDESLDVRVVAAEAIAHLGGVEKAMETLSHILRHGNTYEIVAAQNAIEYLWRDGLIPLDRARLVLAVEGKLEEPTDRIPAYIATANQSDRLVDKNATDCDLRP